MKLRGAILRPPLPRTTLFAILRVVLFYMLFAALWIVLSDSVVPIWFRDPSSQLVVNTVKGMLFVALTSLLLFFFLLRFAAQQAGPVDAAKVGAGGTPPPGAKHILIGSIALLSVVFALLGIGSLLQSWREHREMAYRQLETIAQFKAAQFEDWKKERLGDALVIRSVQAFSTELPQWLKNGDAQARDRLLERFNDFRRAYGYLDIMLCDAQGDIVLQTEDSGHGTSAALRQAVRRALASGTPQMTDLYLMSDHPPEHAHLDFAVPLPSPQPGEKPTTAVVLRVDVNTSLYRYLQTWPVPSASAETLLFRREGETVLFLNELRHQQDSALKLRIPLTADKVLAVQAQAPDYRPDSLLEGIDYRGIPVIGVARPVAGTDWWLIAKVDRDEVFAEARKDALWIILTSLVSCIAAVAMLILLFQRRDLQQEQHRLHEHAEKLRALQLLDAIVGGSTDAIFAKDMEGRYLLFNNAAAHITGKSPAEVVGHDDRILFPAEQAERIMRNDRAVMAQAQTETFVEQLDTTDGVVVFHATKGPLRDAAGQVVGMFGISRDITQLKRAEDDLQRQTEELAARNEELERFNKLVVGRELDMIALKRQANELARALGREPPYPLDFAENPAHGPTP
jgi:PAS domain S-box-containing protein